MSEKTLLEVEGLKKYFQVGKGQTLKAVDDISFQIKKGQTLGLVGESGCGKTTVGRTLLRIYEPDAGKILFDGKDISRVSKKEAKELTRRMQMVFQDPYASLNPFFTVGEIVEEGMKIHKMYHSETERMERVYELLEMVGLNKDHANRFPHEFSGGQRQRVGIARALALNPEFIVCDEPISALDVSIQAQIINLLERIQRERGISYLFIAHDLGAVKHISNRIGAMYLGSLVEIGDSDELYHHPLHPYTQALLASIPIPDPKKMRDRKAQEIAGEIPSPLDIPSGCPFRTRCPYATQRCAEEKPQLKKVGSSQVACHLYDK